MSNHAWPRRRDVRDMAEEQLRVLLEFYDKETETFDPDFLTELRDLMRAGIPFVDAVAISGGRGNH